jgi:hypothetical protein
MMSMSHEPAPPTDLVEEVDGEHVGYLSRTMCTRKGEVVCVTPHANDPRTEVTVVGRLDDGRVIAEYLDSEGELLILTGVTYEEPR